MACSLDMNDALAGLDGRTAGENERCAQVVGRGRYGVVDDDVGACRHARLVGADTQRGTGGTVTFDDDDEVVVFDPIVLIDDFLQDGGDVGRLAVAGAAGC